MESRDNRLIIVVAASLVYAFFFSVISFLRFDAYSYSDFDLAIFTHECWKILHGSTLISLFDQTSIFGNALELISFLTAPIYGLGGSSPKVLLFLQALILGLGAIPIYFIGKDKLPKNVALCIAIAYLFYPAIWFANLYEFNPLTFTTFTLLWAFYFFQKERFVPFMVCVILTLINRADLGVVTCLFGPYAWINRRSMKWILIPTLLSVAWVSIGLFVIIPKYKNILGYDSHYSQFGKGSFSDVIKNIIAHPVVLTKVVCTPENGQFLVQVLSPVFFLPLGAIAEFLLCGLSLLQHLISIRPQEHTIFFHYTSTITPFVFIATIYALSRFIRTLKLLDLIGILILFSTIITNIVYGPVSRWSMYKHELVKTQQDSYKDILVGQIPPQSGVMSSFEFSSHLASRWSYYSFHYIPFGQFRTNVPYPIPKDADYALINFMDPRLRTFYGEDADVRMRKFLNDYAILDMSDSTVLYKKGYKSKLKLFELSPISDTSPKFKTKEGISLLNFTEHTIVKNGFRFLDMQFMWRIDQAIPDTAGMSLILRDDSGKDVIANLRVIGYDLYPTRHWKPTEEVTEHYQMLISNIIPNGHYRLFMALYPMERNGFYLFEGSKDRFIMVGSFNI